MLKSSPLPHTTQQATLDLQVQQYHQSRISKWAKGFIALSSITLLSLGTLHLITYKKHAYTAQEQESLRTHHKTLSKKWGAYQKAAKRLKSLTKEYELIIQKNVEMMLALISEELPERSLITTFNFQAPNQVRLTGYADSHKELAQILHNLSQKGLDNIALIKAHDEPMGVYFEIAYKSKS